MDLLTEAEVLRNRQVISAGYGKQYEGDESDERPLMFNRVTIYEVADVETDFNITIFSHDPNTKTCPGTA